jgi:imidazolonepropionase-like amidohydrolase
MECGKPHFQRGRFCWSGSKNNALSSSASHDCKCVAAQYDESDRKGSLKAGKLADLVILDKNPLKVDPMTLKDIKVMETIKAGKSIYTKVKTGLF